MKRLISVIVVMLFLVAGLPAIFAQGDECTREAVIASFAHAAEAGAVDTWLAEVEESDCPAPVIEGARQLAEAYDTLEVEMVAADAQPDEAANGAIPYRGEHPVFEVSNELGFVFTLEAQDLDIEIRMLNLSPFHDYFLIKEQNDVFKFYPLKSFRHSEPGAEYEHITLANGDVLDAELFMSAENRDTGRESDFGRDTVTLISLPEDWREEEYMNVPGPDDVLWELEIGAPVNETYTTLSPTFVYDNRRDNCMGLGCGSISFTSKLELELDGQSYEMPPAEFKELTFNTEDETVTYVGVQGNEGQAHYDWGRNDDYFVYAPIASTEQYVAWYLPDRESPMLTLRQVEE